MAATILKIRPSCMSFIFKSKDVKNTFTGIGVASDLIRAAGIDYSLLKVTDSEPISLKSIFNEWSMPKGYKINDLLTTH
jgi:hypothetical protein